MSGAATISLPSEGRLAAHSLPWLLGTLDVVRATGALDVTRRKLVRRFVLEDGRLVEEGEIDRAGTDGDEAAGADKAPRVEGAAW